MCVLCDEKIRECLLARGSVDAKWHCPLCGNVSFAKGEDPPAPPVPPEAPYGVGKTIASVALYAALAAVLVAIFTGFRF